MARAARAAWLCGAVWCACETTPGPPPAATWRTEEEALSAALLSVWGPDDGSLVHAVGAQAGQGPLWLVRTPSGAWQPLETAATPGDLWWVHGLVGGPTYAVGASARVLRLDPGASVPVAMQVAGVDPVHTFFGVWVAPGGEAWAVGGDASAYDGTGVVVRLEAGSWAAVTDLPSEVSKTALFFKVFGFSADDLWVVGEEGTALHFDGQAWALEVVPGKPRLVTVHGLGERLLAVGGVNGAVIYERVGGAWVDRSPELVPALNGVRLSSGGAVAVGNNGTVLFEGASRAWEPDGEVPTFDGLHVAWWAPDGRLYAAGGDLMALTRGVLVSYGP